MKIFYKTFGCRVNQIETESLSEKFSSVGCEREDDLSACDMVFINSCSVTEKADKDILNFVKKSAAMGKKIAVTGCYSSLFPGEILKIAPQAVLIPNSQKHLSAQILFKASSQDDFFSVSGSYGRTRAFVKVQDGCDLKCSYCIVPYGRPVLKSKTYSKTLSEIDSLIKKGFKEITVSGTRLGRYECPETGFSLKELLKGIFSLDGNFRIRLSSLEPMEIDSKLLEICRQAGEKFCDHFHIPIQHCCDNILKDMKRPYNFAFVKEKIEIIKEMFPQSGVFADIISSFPTETCEDFKLNKQRIEELSLSGIHAFTYSSRPFTEASKMPQIDSKIKKERSLIIREFDLRLRAFFALSMKDKKLNVLSLRKKDGFYLGLSSNFLNVILPDKCVKNQFYNVKIKTVNGSFLAGEI
ncbi:MAG: MiaB/RimO family radical SAM methylthiotransferase [Elusimicrobia bacterium]|nr:MiaB/RimO family radical SAM methylthiotransferase [Elusimicrobiota bacterium]